MKCKFLNSALFLLVFILFYIPSSYPSDPTFNFYLANATWDSHKVYEVDILIQSTDSISIELAALSMGFTIPNGSVNNGTITASIVPGSSELSNTSQIPTNFKATNITRTDSSVLRVIMIANKPFPAPGYGSILSNVSPGTRIGRLRITNTVDFSVYGSNSKDIPISYSRYFIYRW